MSEPAATWSKRFIADRPRLDPQGAEILLWQGAHDDLASPALAQCGFEKIAADVAGDDATAAFTICGDRNADHQTLLSDNMTWTARWIASRTLGEPEPEACPDVEALQPADGTELACPAIHGNFD